MPHDAKGNLLNVGDKVNIPATIKNIYMSEDYCNVDIEFDIPMPPYETKSIYSALNTKQVIKRD